MGDMRRKPDGTYTTDEQEYCDAWRNSISLIEVATGYKMTSFDPSYHLSNKEGDSVVLSNKFVTALSGIIKP